MTPRVQIAKVLAPPRTALSLWTNISLAMLGTSIYAIAQWAALVVLVKLGNAEMVGQYALGLAVTAPIILFANL